MKQTYTRAELSLAISKHEKAIDLLEEIQNGEEFFLILNELRRRLVWLEVEQFTRDFHEATRE